jgi:hypothetical protein
MIRNFNLDANVEGDSARKMARFLSHTPLNAGVVNPKLARGRFERKILMLAEASLD